MQQRNLGEDQPLGVVASDDHGDYISKLHMEELKKQGATWKVVQLKLIYIYFQGEQ